MGISKHMQFEQDYLESLREELEEYCDSCGECWSYVWGSNSWDCDNCGNTSEAFEKKTGVAINKPWDELVSDPAAIAEEIKVLEAKKVKIFGDRDINEVSSHRCPTCRRVMEEYGGGKMSFYLCAHCADEARDREDFDSDEDF